MGFRRHPGFLLTSIFWVAPAFSQVPAQTATLDAPPPATKAAVDAADPTFTVSDLPSGRPLRIVVYGDMRFTDPGNTSDTQPRVRKWLAGKVGEEKPDLLLLTGDMPFHGSEAADWKIYDQETASWAQQRLRVYPTIGNHEGLPDPRRGIQNYFAAYPQIDHHNWYSVRMGNILLITLDSSTFVRTGREQRAWLGSS